MVPNKAEKLQTWSAILIKDIQYNMENDCFIGFVWMVSFGFGGLNQEISGMVFPGSFNIDPARSDNSANLPRENV
jgi:hypothetical protein